MNERIRELADQAENYAHEQNDKFGLSYKREYDKKFAELIVRECISICNRRGEALQHHLDERSKNMAEEPRAFTAGAISGSLRSAQSISQHFGVEE